MTSLRIQAGELLEALRGDLSVGALAKLLGVSRQTIMKRERGQLSLNQLDKVADVYGVRFRVVALLPDGSMWTPGAGPAPGLADRWRDRS